MRGVGRGWEGHGWLLLECQAKELGFSEGNGESLKVLSKGVECVNLRSVWNINLAADCEMGLVQVQGLEIGRPYSSPFYNICGAPTGCKAPCWAPRAQW